MRRQRLMVTVGSCGQALRLAPVIRTLSWLDEFETRVLCVARQPEVPARRLASFGLEPDLKLRLATAGSQPGDAAWRTLEALQPALSSLEPDLVLVQGDGVATFAAALAAYYLKVPVAHVEAGLRGPTAGDPFPAEAHRRLTSVLTELHLAPTPLAGRRLLAEGVSAERILVTGNTVVDAIEQIVATPCGAADALIRELPEGARLLLVTAFRDTPWDRSFELLCSSLRDLVRRFDDLHVAFPKPFNRAVHQALENHLAGAERWLLLDPLDDLTRLHLTARARLVISDQKESLEEAPSLGTPVLMLREAPERPEAFTAGIAHLARAGKALTTAATRLLDAAPQAARPGNPYGDGKAAERIAKALIRRRYGQRPLLAGHEQFAPTAIPATGHAAITLTPADPLAGFDPAADAIAWKIDGFFAPAVEEPLEISHPLLQGAAG